MRARSLLQPTYTLAAGAVQEARFAKRVGHGKSGVAIANVYRNAATATGTITFAVETASHTAVRADTTNAFWKEVGNGVLTWTGSGITGAVKFKITDLGEWIRWNITGVPSAGIDFDITVYLADT